MDELKSLFMEINSFRNDQHTANLCVVENKIAILCRDVCESLRRNTETNIKLIMNSDVFFNDF